MPFYLYESHFIINKIADVNYNKRKLGNSNRVFAAMEIGGGLFLKSFIVFLKPSNSL